MDPCGTKYSPQHCTFCHRAVTSAPPSSLHLYPDSHTRPSSIPGSSSASLPLHVRYKWPARGETCYAAGRRLQQSRAVSQAFPHHNLPQDNQSHKRPQSETCKRTLQKKPSKRRGHQVQSHATPPTILSFPGIKKYP